MEKGEEKVELKEIEKEEKISNQETQILGVDEKENKEINFPKEEKNTSSEIKKEDEKNLENDKEKVNNLAKEKNRHKKESSFSAQKIIFIVVLIIMLLFISTIFAVLNINNSNIVSGVYIENIDISNMTKEQATNVVNERLKGIEEIELCYGEYSTIVKLEEIGIDISLKETINKAINFGKTNNIIIDNYSILKAKLFKTKFEIEINIDEEKLEEVIKNIQAEIPGAIKEYSYDIKENELIITRGESGQKIIKEDLKDKIKLNIKEQFNCNVKPTNIPTEIKEPEKIDIQKIYSQVYKKAKDAYIIEEPFELHKEENGIDFAISIEEANKIIKEEKETYIIPLEITKPKVAIKDLGDKLFKQKLSNHTTIYDAGNGNRSHNIALAAKTINGTILLPGETFSYNGILGNTNKEKGYKLGTAYVGGKVVESYGGGICQVSSTLYNSVLYANLEIVERYNHSYVVNYVPAGRDATVAYGGKDFKFKNTRSYPIKIVASAKNGVVSISIMGIKEEKEYEVVLTSTVLSTTPRTVIYENNSNLEEGTQKVIQNGYDGKKSIAYKIIKYNGQTISKTVLSKDTYKAMSKIVQVGTKKVNTPVISPSTENDITTDTTNNAI